MSDLIKSCRLIHNLIVGACAAIIAFALTPDAAETYRGALREIHPVQSLKREAYSNYALHRLSERRAQTGSRSFFETLIQLSERRVRFCHALLFLRVWQKTVPAKVLDSLHFLRV